MSTTAELCQVARDDDDDDWDDDDDDWDDDDDYWEIGRDGQDGR